MSLRDVLAAAASNLEEAETTSGVDGIEWTRRGRLFAALSDGGVAEFLLDRHVAAAASQTPDTVVSSRGAGWVRFSPESLDDHGMDRASAWFASAYRRQERG